VNEDVPITQELDVHLFCGVVPCDTCSAAVFGFNGRSWFLGVIIDVENQERFPGDIHEQLPSAVRIQGRTVPVTNCNGEAPVCSVRQVAVL